MEVRVVADISAAAADLFAETRPRTVALAGGSTPRRTYERIAGLDYPWEEVDFFFGDERCVPPDHPDSNFRNANTALLSSVPLARVHPMTGCDPRVYERELESVFGAGIPCFGLMFLGLGGDGHTASLFPGDPALDVADRNVVLVDRPDHRRMSLTLPVLSAAKLVVFLVEGAAKRRVLAELRAGADIPAARVTAGWIVVIADEEAAGSPD